MNREQLAAQAQAFDLSEADIEDTAEWLAGQMRQRAELWQASGQAEPASMRAAYFSPSWTAFQADRGRDFSVIVDGVSN